MKRPVKKDDRDLDWDPEPHERTWFTHVRDGDRGYLVRRSGVDKIRLDRPALDEDGVLRSLSTEWKRDHEWRPLNRGQLAKVAFDADRSLCFALGLHDAARSEWLSLRDRDRQVWMGDGPPEGIRKKLFFSIMEALGELYR